MDTHPMQDRRRQFGMTLIEVLVSMLIFSFGFLGLIGMQARAVQISTDSEDRARAAMLANELVSTMWTQQTVALPAATVSAWQARVGDTTSGLPNSSGTVSAPDATSKMVAVTIKWHSPSKNAAAQDNQYTTQVVMP